MDTRTQKGENIQRDRHRQTQAERQAKKYGKKDRQTWAVKDRMIHRETQCIHGHRQTKPDTDTQTYIDR